MKIKPKLMIIVIISLFLVGTLITGFSTKLVTDEMYERMEEELSISVEGYSGNVNYLKETGKDIEIIVFEGDTRVESSINGVVGTKADKEVIEAVLNNGEPFFVRDITIGGKDYCGYYKPTDNGMLFSGKSKDELANIQRKTCFSLMGISTLVVLLTCIAASIALGHMVDRIGKVHKMVERLSDGDLTQEIEIFENAKDEIKLMSNAVSKLQSILSSIVTEIQDNAAQLNESNSHFLAQFSDIKSSVENVNTAVDEIAQGATSQAQETTKTAEQIADMGSVVAISNKAVRNLDVSVEHMNKLSASAKEILEKLGNIINNNAERIKLVSSQTNATNQSVDKIKSAADVIQDIADQTNLLSLNASIEAAHAGDTGRGFAVVAGEIRNLADNSSQNVNIIKDIIKELSQNSEDSVHTMESIILDTQTQQDELKSTLEAFEVLITEINSVAEATASILEQMSNLAKSREIISDVTETLSAVSEENAASTEETAASMQTLSATIEDCVSEVQALGNLSQTLKIQVSKFKTNMNTDKGGFYNERNTCKP